MVFDKYTMKSPNAMGQGVDMGLVDIVALIRSVQRAEGNFDCFRRGQGYCDRHDCLWRKYCLGDNQRVENGET